MWWGRQAGSIHLRLLCNRSCKATGVGSVLYPSGTAGELGLFFKSVRAQFRAPRLGRWLKGGKGNFLNLETNLEKVQGSIRVSELQKV